MPVFPTQAVPTSVSGYQEDELAGIPRVLSVSADFRSQNAFEQAELILHAALDPSVASKARKGDFIRCIDHFDLLQTAIN